VLLHEEQSPQKTWQVEPPVGYYRCPGEEKGGLDRLEGPPIPVPQGLRLSF